MYQLKAILPEYSSSNELRFPLEASAVLLLMPAAALVLGYTTARFGISPAEFDALTG